ncbi:MAG: caspase family protein, partial [Alphaproteobacteria bacterium]
MRHLAAIFGLIVLGLAAMPALAGEGRVALVVGNGNYSLRDDIPALPNAPNDGRAVAAALDGLGFDVITVIDADRATFEQALRDFGRRSIGAEIALFFYAGHGLQVDRENYLLPVSADIETQRDLEYEAVSLSQVKREMEYAGADLGVMILDACRNNPLSRSLARRSMALGRSVATDAGLAPVQGARGMLIAYATDPDNVALDGEGRNSPFTTALVEHIGDPDLDVRVMFGRVRGMVVDMTDGAQTPWVEEAVIGEFRFNPTGSEPAGAAPIAAVGPPTIATEVVFWQSVQTIAAADAKVAALESYLRRYPEGEFAELAEIQMGALADRDGAVATVRASTVGDTQTAAIAPVAPPTAERTSAGARGLIERAEQDDREAQVDLAFRFETGDGVGQDDAEAARWYRVAAQRGSPVAQDSLGDMYALGRGVAVDHAEARRWWALFEDHDAAGLAEAAAWYRTRAEQGDVRAQNKIGIMHRDGRGVPQDDPEAVRWSRLAAEQGYGAAQVNLGWMY